MIGETGMYCWFGNDLYEKVITNQHLFELIIINLQSSILVEACYFMKWYKCNTKIKRILLIMMERSKRPLSLTAGKFLLLSLATLMMVELFLGN